MIGRMDLDVVIAPQTLVTDEMLEIEHELFEFPWTRGEFRVLVEDRRCPCYAAWHQGSIVGYIIFSRLPSETHIITLAVTKQFQRRGVGKKLINELNELLEGREELSERRVTINVRETNLTGQLFLRACGFQAIEILRKHYNTVEEDAYLMEYKPWSSSQEEPAS